MAILIDMDMPKRCRECNVLIDCDGCEGWRCKCGISQMDVGYLNELSKKNSRPYWCPLREVVRCKDCKNASECIVPESVYCDEMDRAVDCQGYCHHGEWREE